MPAALDRQLARLSRGELARDSLEQFGALVLARDADEAVACVNQLAPEHLHIVARDAGSAVPSSIDNAGAIFLGPYTPVALGDYAAGPSHVLPTGGTARFASGLSANDFLRRSSVLCVHARRPGEHGRRRAPAGREGRADRPRRQRRRASGDR